MDGKSISLSDSESFTLRASLFLAKAERDQKHNEFNNLYIKNFPTPDFSEDDLRQLFQPFGALSSVKIDSSGSFGFVSFEKNSDAMTALNHFTNKESSDQDKGKMLVTRCLKKEERLKQLRKESMRYLRDLTKFNIYFRGFPTGPDETLEGLTAELTQYFSAFGEIRSIKLMTKTTLVESEKVEKILGFGFVSFQSYEVC
jgi:RNA recognition motif-containing protein